MHTTNNINTENTNIHNDIIHILHVHNNMHNDSNNIISPWFELLLNCLLLTEEKLCGATPETFVLDLTEKFFLCLTRGAIIGTVLDGYQFEFDIILFYYFRSCTLLHCHDSIFQKMLLKPVIKSNVKSCGCNFENFFSFSKHI